MGLALQEIAKLTPLEAESLRGRAVAGDTFAARDYLLYAAWRQIDSKNLSPKEKAKSLRVLSEVVGEVELTHG